MFDVLPWCLCPKTLVTESFAWSSMQKNVRTRVQFQKAKVHRHTVAPVGQFATVTRSFAHVHTGIVGPLSPCGRVEYLFAIFLSYFLIPLY